MTDSQINNSNSRHQQYDLPPQQGDLQEYIQVLQEHQITCEAQGKYLEAESAMKRIEELKVELERQQNQEIKQRHVAEKMRIEKAHLEEFNEFNEFWDKKMQEFDEEAIKIKDDLIERQEDEYYKIEQELQKTISLRPKESSEILNLRKIEQNLAKQKSYQEAHQVQQKIKQLEKKEEANWILQRQQKIQKQLQQLRVRQQNELNALAQRIFAGQEEQRKSRSIELERLLQKYQNVKKEIDSENEKELLAFTKQFKSKGVSNYATRSRFNASQQY
ncbi:hypothetical protein PPERSA_08355 [Pseudocohnilembus persalinus]|uniref:Uncharacterized protein n=1 Tax=Pseudocohnilembus persalinus TaxID=266149 RepID=A0A0V0QPM5_PSEPJ|nr:hypothetical protein PPERSA_08355 [Pseudocohnilembus persalinus]|eukprot:KRX04140.1 hypothetical protein PPERSA_08355 [Pseudocohnilembus persalinus]